MSEAQASLFDLQSLLLFLFLLLLLLLLLPEALVLVRGPPVLRLAVDRTVEDGTAAIVERLLLAYSTLRG